MIPRPGTPGRPPEIPARRGIPRPYPGCWKDKNFKRRYARMHARLHREGWPSYQRQLARGLQGRVEREEKRRDARLSRSRLSRCAFCLRPMREWVVRRVLFDAREIDALVPYCGEC